MLRLGALGVRGFPSVRSRKTRTRTGGQGLRAGAPRKRKNMSNSTPGLSDLEFNLVTVLANKAKGSRAYQTYVADARKANSSECAELLERIWRDDLRHIDELKQHVAAVLTGKMGNRDQKPAAAQASQSGQPDGQEAKESKESTDSKEQRATSPQSDSKAQPTQVAESAQQSLDGMNSETKSQKTTPPAGG